jgi:hypothetical protein
VASWFRKGLVWRVGKEDGVVWIASPSSTNSDSWLSDRVAAGVVSYVCRVCVLCVQSVHVCACGVCRVSCSECACVRVVCVSVCKCVFIRRTQLP